VLANGRCDVLKGQCLRSNAGLFYESYEEFAETLYALESNGPLHARLGMNGRDFFVKHYAWPVIERKYLDMFARLSAAKEQPAVMEPLPNWWRRRRADQAPAAELLRQIPVGAATVTAASTAVDRRRPA
jgi:hypothetical protein